jgi:nucleoside 2-deoxyribosyltransferase
MYSEVKSDRFRPNNTCPVCDSNCHLESDFTGTTKVVCPVCGKYRFGPSMELFFSDFDIKELRYRLSFFLRTLAERGAGKRDNSYFPVHDESSLRPAIQANDPTVREKLETLLLYIAKLSRFPGQVVPIDAANDYPIICGKNLNEANFCVESLKGLGFISVELTLDRTPLCKITATGWQELERLEQTGADSPHGFIAMWFDASQDAARDTIKSAIVGAGYLPIRIDEVQHVNKIDDEIVARIRQSKFMVADFTGQRQGVYFEAGFMLGLGRPVIWICNESNFKEVHFDARQYNTIVYNELSDLMTKLQFRIEAILGKGPIAP